MTANTAHDTIGHGTWLDKLAHDLIRRETRLGRSVDMIIVESGLGASGIPHIGSLGDAARAYGIKLALENLGYDSKLIAYSDDLDGLRKVPAGLPESLDEHLAKPVSLIPDPYPCNCGSYGQHMSGILLEGLDKVGIKYESRRAYDTYGNGLLSDQIDTILTRHAEIGNKIAEMVGQEKYKTRLPYFPVCSECDRLYTAQAIEYLPSEKKVRYRCCDAVMGGKAISGDSKKLLQSQGQDLPAVGRPVKGCGHEGESDITRDLGKLAWKVEFAARWTAFDVRFEAFGKDIMDSVHINDWVAEEILGFAPPTHAKYEMFLDKGGKKISKSAGNVLTAQRWMEFGTPQSILLLLYKRMTGAREISVQDDVPFLMNEFNELEDVYFGRVRKELKNNPARLAKTRGLYLYANLLNPPEHPGAHISYMLAVQLAKMYKTADNRTERVAAKLADYGVIRDGESDNESVARLVELAGRYADEFADYAVAQTLRADAGASESLGFDDKPRKALLEIARMLDSEGSPDAIQTGIYNAAKSNDVPPKEIFAALYRIILGADRGPRLGPFISDIGNKKVSRMITERI